jgi:hypothetical protein
MSNHYFEPESEAYELRNPGLLMALPPEVGKRHFSCHRAGYTALCDRVIKHFKAHPDQNVASALESFGIKMRQQQENALDFMARCANSTLKLDTSLDWFLENGNHTPTS